MSPSGTSYPVSSRVAGSTIADKTKSEAEIGEDQASNARVRAAFDLAREERNERAMAKRSSAKAPPKSNPGSNAGIAVITRGILKRSRDRSPGDGKKRGDVVKKVRK